MTRARAALVAAALATLLGVGGGGGPTLGPARARAEVTYDLSPVASLGYTTNALAGRESESSAFLRLSGLAHVRYRGARAFHTFGYRLSYTHFFIGRFADVVTNEVLASSLFNLTSTLDLRLNAVAALSRTSRVDLQDPATVMPQAAVIGATTYLATSAGEELIYQPTARWRFSESLTVGQVRYLYSPAPTNTSVIGILRGDYLQDRNTYSLEGRVADVFISGSHNVLVQILAGWRREISPTWFTELQAGMLAVFRSVGPATYGPAAIATVGYRREHWYATLVLSRTAVPNLFLGAATVNDQALARVTLPLTRTDQLVLSGYGGYLYAHTTTLDGGSARAYDMRMAGVTLGARAATLPLFATLDYGFIDQNGSMLDGGQISSLRRHVIMLNVGATFTFGPGSPPIVGGRL